MRALFVLSLFVFSLSACSKKITSTTSSVRDSIIIREIVRYDTVRVKADTIRVKQIIECDSVTNKPKPFKIKEHSGRAKATVEVKSNGELTVTASCDSLELVVQTLDREVFRLRHEQKQSTTIKQPSKFKIWIDYSAYALALIFILYIIFNVVKAIYKP